MQYYYILGCKKRKLYFYIM